MSKENVFIVISHVHSLKPGSNNVWETAERVEFVNQLRKKHVVSSTMIADYTRKKIVSGARYGIDNYNALIEYVGKKYPKQLAELNALYGVETTTTASEFTDSFGNTRSKTVFDV